MKTDMDQLTNPLEIYKLLKKTNCGECRHPSCMAFSVAVIQGRQELAGCPYLEPGTLAGLQGRIATRKPFGTHREEALKELQARIASVDFAAAVPRLPAALANGRLAITCLGREFQIDRTGRMFSEVHVNTWIQVPLLHYILFCQGVAPAGTWVNLAGLNYSAEWGQYINHRVEEPLRQLFDAHPELISAILDVLGAQPLTGITAADRSLLIRPLPRVPFLINYWQHEDGFGSQLNILFDRSADRNINVESIYLLGRGLVEMIRCLIVRHGRDGKLF